MKKPSSLLIVPISLSLSIEYPTSRYSQTLFFLSSRILEASPSPRTKTQLDGDGLSIKYARVTGGIDREIGPIVLNYEGSTDRDVELRRYKL